MVRIIPLFTSFTFEYQLTCTIQPVASVSLIALASVQTLGVSTYRISVTFIGISCALIDICNITRIKMICSKLRNSVQSDTLETSFSSKITG